MSSLPGIIVLKSSHPKQPWFRDEKPFCVRHCIRRDEYNNILNCDKDDIASPHSKFQLVKVNSEKGLYRIKCCYNNKFWRCGYKGFIQATEKETGDSTLFKIEPVDTNMNTYRFMCMEQQSYVCFDYEGLSIFRSPEWLLKVAALSNDSHDIFTVINWESLVILPKNVAFKTNNDQYILPGHYPEESLYPWIFLVENPPKPQKHHLYASTTDIGDRRVAHQIITLSDQKIAVKNNFTSLFWTYDPSYRKGQPLPFPKDHDFLIAESDDPSKPESQFMPIKFSDDTNLIALRNVDKNTLCYRHLTHFVVSDDKDRTPFEEAKVRVEELVLSRKVYDADFRFDDTFIDDQKVQVKKHSNFFNNSLDRDIRGDIKLTHHDSISSSYDTCVSVKTISGVSLDIPMPIFENVLYVTPSAAFTEEEENRYSWGETSDTSLDVDVVLNVNVPPKTKVMAKMDVTKTTCNIPFSYTQRDLTTRGEYVVEVKEDGVYTCENCYIYDIEITEEAVN